MPGVPKKWISVAVEHLPSAKQVLATVGTGVGIKVGGDMYEAVKQKLRQHGIPHTAHDGAHDQPQGHHRVH